MAPGRNNKCQKKDFFPLLPEEMQDMILQLISVHDLENCLRVSKHWKKMTNRDLIWKRHCLAHGITPEKVETYEEDSNSTLCKYAQVWFKFKNTPLYRWQTKSWKSYEIVRKPYLFTVSDGKSIVFSGKYSLIVWDISQLGKIKYHIKLPFAIDPFCYIEVHEQHIVLATCNILVFYKMMKNQCKTIFAVAITKGVFIHSCTNITSFLKENYIKDFPNITIEGFKNSCLWMTHPKDFTTYIVNLINKKVTPVEFYYLRFFSNSYVVSRKYMNLGVHDYFGRKVFELHQEVERAVANDKLLVTFSYKAEYGYQLMMETWNLITGERHLCIPYPHYKYIELHPSRNIIFGIDLQNYMSAISAITGEELWKTSIPYVVDIYDWGIKVICEKYLVLYQNKLWANTKKNELYLLDVDSGRFINKTDRPLGNLEHLSDNLVIVMSPTKFFIRTFIV